MHRRRGPAPVHEHSVKGQAESRVDEDDVPHTEHAATLLHHDGMDEGRQRQPGHEGGILHRVPEPETAPAQDCVGPPGTQQQSAGQQGPGDYSPQPPRVGPLIPLLSRHQGTQGKCKGYAHRNKPGHQRWGMEKHSKVGEQRVDALAVQGHKGQLGKGVGHEGHDGDEKDLNHHQGGGGVGQEVLHPFRRPPDGDGGHH